MVPSSRALRSTGAKPPAEWQPPEDVAAWLRLNRCDATGLRQDGGFLFRIEASDPDAAVPRVAEDMIREPRRTLALVQKHATNAFRCLYRHRNMVLHGALTNAVALRASLRTAAPLVGAGIDRIIHAHYVEELQPLPLVARARLALATVGSAGGPAITDLLGTDSQSSTR